VVERPLECLGPTPSAATSAPAAAPPARLVRVVAGVVAVIGLLLLGGFVLLGLALGLERGCHECVVLGAQVLLGGLGAHRGGIAFALSVRRGELVLTLEGADVGDGDLELVRDPGVGAPLADPGPDLVQLRL
jgi:hypothetical protein